jgi:hypothetical protein
LSKGNDYEGAIVAAKQLKKLVGKAYRFYVGERLPTDPEEIIKFAAELKRKEALQDRADEAKEYIKKTMKARSDKERAARRAKIRRIFGKRE